MLNVETRMPKMKIVVSQVPLGYHHGPPLEELPSRVQPSSYHGNFRGTNSRSRMSACHSSSKFSGSFYSFVIASSKLRIKLATLA